MVWVGRSGGAAGTAATDGGSDSANNRSGGGGGRRTSSAASSVNTVGGPGSACRGASTSVVGGAAETSAFPVPSPAAGAAAELVVSGRASTGFAAAVAVARSLSCCCGGGVAFGTGCDACSSSEEEGEPVLTAVVAALCADTVAGVVFATVARCGGRAGRGAKVPPSEELLLDPKSPLRRVSFAAAGRDGSDRSVVAFSSFVSPLAVAAAFGDSLTGRGAGAVRRCAGVDPDDAVVASELRDAAEAAEEDEEDEANSVRRFFDGFSAGQ